MAVKKDTLQTHMPTLEDIHESDISERESGESLEGSEEEEEDMERGRTDDLSNADNANQIQMLAVVNTISRGKMRKTKAKNDVKPWAKSREAARVDEDKDSGRTGTKQVKHSKQIQSRGACRLNETNTPNYDGTRVSGKASSGTSIVVDVLPNKTGSGDSVRKPAISEHSIKDPIGRGSKTRNDNVPRVTHRRDTLDYSNHVDGIHVARKTLAEGRGSQDDEPGPQLEVARREEDDTMTGMTSDNGSDKSSVTGDSTRRSSGPDDAKVSMGSSEQLTRSHSPASLSEVPGIEYKEPTMTAPNASHIAQHRSSLFDLSARRPTVHGSSLLSFAVDPSRVGDDDFFPPKPQLKTEYENTYRMEPEKKFLTEAVNAIIKEELETKLEGKTYEPISCGILAKTIAQDIKHRVQAMNFPRYRYVSLVSIGEKRDQGVRFGSRCVWDAGRDSFATDFYETSSIYAVGTLYAIYYE